jgi:YVTN family beta-propeller protein
MYMPAIPITTTNCGFCGFRGLYQRTVIVCSQRFRVFPFFFRTRRAGHATPVGSAILAAFGQFLREVFMRFLGIALSLAVLGVVLHSTRAGAPANSPGMLFVANQFDHTANLVDLSSRKAVARIGVDVNGHEVVVSPDHKFGYVPIYGNSGVGKPGTDGATIEIVDLRAARAVRIIDLGKPVRPHCAKFGPDGMLYVSAELANAIYIVDPASGKVIGEAPTGDTESHMFVLSPDGKRAYTANVGPGTVSVVDLENRKLVAVIPVAKHVQRISISPDGKRVFTHDQGAPRIAVIDTATNKLARSIDLPASVYSSAPTPDGKWLVANAPSGKAFVIDLSSEKVVGSYPIPEAIGAITVDASGAFAYISCPAKGTIEVLNLRAAKLEEPIVMTPGVDGLEWIPGIS